MAKKPLTGPADTDDPDQRVSSVTPDKATAATAGRQTVNAVAPLPKPPATRRNTSNDRTEKYQATRPDGTEVTVTHNLDTGETTVS